MSGIFSFRESFSCWYRQVIFDSQLVGPEKSNNYCYFIVLQVHAVCPYPWAMRLQKDLQIGASARRFL